MTITINSKEYPIHLHGTVGHVIYAQNLLSSAGITEPSQMMQTQATMYAAFVASNEEVDPLPSFTQFINHWTTKELNEFSEWWNKRWNELEGTLPETDEEKEQRKAEEGKKKEENL